jgi:hypothetical protein
MSVFDNIIDKPTPGAPKGIVYGPPGIGKTTFGALATDAIVIDCEQGANAVPCQRTPYLSTWTEIHRWLTALETEDHPYQTVAIDTIDWLLRRMEEHVSGSVQNIEATIHRAHGGYGNGPKVLNNYLYQYLLPLLDRIVARGIAVLLLAHSKVSTITDEDGIDSEKVTPAINEGKRGQQGHLGILTEWSDFVVLARNGEQGRVLQTQETQQALAKNRYGLPPIVPFEWNAFTATIREGLSKTWNQETQ